VGGKSTTRLLFVNSLVKYHKIMHGHQNNTRGNKVQNIYMLSCEDVFVPCCEQDHARTPCWHWILHLHCICV